MIRQNGPETEFLRFYQSSLFRCFSPEGFRSEPQTPWLSTTHSLSHLSHFFASSQIPLVLQIQKILLFETFPLMRSSLVFRRSVWSTPTPWIDHPRTRNPHRLLPRSDGKRLRFAAIPIVAFESPYVFPAFLAIVSSLVLTILILHRNSLPFWVQLSSMFFSVKSSANEASYHLTTHVFPSQYILSC